MVVKGDIPRGSIGARSSDMAERIMVTCTRQQLNILLAAFEVKIERMIVDGWTTAQLKEEYNAMLSRHMQDWQKGKEYLDSLEKKIG